MSDCANLVALDTARVLIAPPEVKERRDVALRGSRLKQLAADQGHAAAQYKLGCYYDEV